MGQLEVIPLTGTLSEQALKYPVYNFANRGVHLDKHNVYYAKDGVLYKQDRVRPQLLDQLDLSDYGIEGIRINKYHAYDKTIIFLVNYANGRKYIFKFDTASPNEVEFVEKHGPSGRILTAGDSLIIISGAVKTNYGSLINKYDLNEISARGMLGAQKIDSLRSLSPPFAIAVYDENLQLVDSLDTINRTQGRGAAFFDLWLDMPMDISEEDEIYIADMDAGYNIEKYSIKGELLATHDISSGSFKAIQAQLDLSQIKKYKSMSGVFSRIYALYEKGDYLITSYFDNPANREPAHPPYYFDIISKDGQHQLSGASAYPIIAEDTEEKIFLLVKQEGGWFSSDKIYLVGLTLENFFEGQYEKEIVDRAIMKYEKRGG